MVEQDRDKHTKQPKYITIITTSHPPLLANFSGYCCPTLDNYTSTLIFQVS